MDLQKEHCIVAAAKMKSVNQLFYFHNVLSDWPRKKGRCKQVSKLQLLDQVYKYAQNEQDKNYAKQKHFNYSTVEYPSKMLLYSILHIGPSMKNSVIISFLPASDWNHAWLYLHGATLTWHPDQIQCLSVAHVGKWHFSGLRGVHTRFCYGSLS